jgi:inner membrane protein
MSKAISNLFSDKQTFKILVIGFLALILLIPTSWVQDLVRERKKYRNEASQEVQKLWGGEQKIGTPTMTLPYVYLCPVSEKSEEDKKSKKEPEMKQCTGYFHMFPETAIINANLPTTSRKRGIFDIPLYHGEVDLGVSFKEPNWVDIGISKQQIIWDKVNIGLWMQDHKGLKETPMVYVEDQKIQLEPSFNTGTAFRKDLSGSLINAQSILERSEVMNFKIRFKGADKLHIVPFASENRVTFQSDWAHPKFSGDILPDDRTITKEGFTATWKVLGINHNQPKYWWFTEEYSCDFNVGFDQLVPVDQYSMTERAIKYAKLFIFLTFILCFFAETLTGKRVHPLQYTLIGFSLLIFFTILLSLSEHISFGSSYLIATLIVSLQIGAFLQVLVRNKWVSGVGVVLLIGLYSFLFSLLKSEDYALLTGTLGLFAILSGLMYLSTKINWYNAANIQNDKQP